MTTQRLCVCCIQNNKGFAVTFPLPEYLKQFYNIAPPRCGATALVVMLYGIGKFLAVGILLRTEDYRLRTLHPVQTVYC